MLLIQNGDNIHYVYIKDINKLLANKTKRNRRMYYCTRCLHGFIRENLLEKHKKDCREINDGKAAPILPKKFKDRNGKWRIPTTHFKNHHKKLPKPFTIYADFEAILENLEAKKKSDRESYTIKEKKTYSMWL